MLQITSTDKNSLHIFTKAAYIFSSCAARTVQSRKLFRCTGAPAVRMQLSYSTSVSEVVLSKAFFTALYLSACALCSCLLFQGSVPQLMGLCSYLFYSTDSINTWLSLTSRLTIFLFYVSQSLPHLVFVTFHKHKILRNKDLTESYSAVLLKIQCAYSSPENWRSEFRRSGWSWKVMLTLQVHGSHLHQEGSGQHLKEEALATRCPVGHRSVLSWWSLHHRLIPYQSVVLCATGSCGTKPGDLRSEKFLRWRSTDSRHSSLHSTNNVVHFYLCWSRWEIHLGTSLVCRGLLARSPKIPKEDHVSFRSQGIHHIAVGFASFSTIFVSTFVSLFLCVCVFLIVFTLQLDFFIKTMTIFIFIYCCWR